MEMVPLCEKENVRSVLDAVRDSKQGRAHSSDQLPTPRDISRIQAVMRQAIHAELEAEGLIRLCDSVIEAGNKCFRGIYEKVWELDYGNGSGKRLCDSELVKLRSLGKHKRQQHRELMPLLLEAKQTKPEASSLIRDLAMETGAEPVDDSTLKKAVRIIEKAELRKDEPGNVDGIFDILIVHNLEELATLLGKVRELAERASLRIVRVKDRLSVPTSGGWRDVMINFTLPSGGHVCELQLAVSHMVDARKSLPGHLIYQRVRNANELLEKLGVEVKGEQRVSALRKQRRKLGRDASEDELIAALSRLRHLGCPLPDLLAAGYSTDELRSAGFTEAALEEVHALLNKNVGERQVQVFLSYRVASDSDLVERLYDKLKAKNVKCWWDKKCLKPGVSWEDGFADGLMSSAIVVPIISEAALANFTNLSTSSPCDNVLLEHRLALELQARGKICYVMPLIRGNFNFGNVFPTAIVEAVEAATARHLERAGQGEPFCAPAVNDTFKLLMKNQGFVLGANEASRLQEATEVIFSMAGGIDEVTTIMSPAEGDIGGGGGGSDANQEAFKVHVDVRYALEDDGRSCVYLSHCEADTDLAHRMRDKLGAEQVYVAAPDVGRTADENIANGLLESTVFVPVLSANSLQALTGAGSGHDCLLFEYVLALELKARGRMHRIVPLVVSESCESSDLEIGGCDVSPLAASVRQKALSTLKLAVRDDEAAGRRAAWEVDDIEELRTGRLSCASAVREVVKHAHSAAEGSLEKVVAAIARICGRTKMVRAPSSSAKLDPSVQESAAGGREAQVMRDSLSDYKVMMLGERDLILEMIEHRREEATDETDRGAIQQRTQLILELRDLVDKTIAQVRERLGSSQVVEEDQLGHALYHVALELLGRQRDEADRRRAEAAQNLVQSTATEKKKIVAGADESVARERELVAQMVAGLDEEQAQAEVLWVEEQRAKKESEQAALEQRDRAWEELLARLGTRVLAMDVADAEHEVNDATEELGLAAADTDDVAHMIEHAKVVQAVLTAQEAVVKLLGANASPDQVVLDKCLRELRDTIGLARAPSMKLSATEVRLLECVEQTAQHVQRALQMLSAAREEQAAAMRAVSAPEQMKKDAHAYLRKLQEKQNDLQHASPDQLQVARLALEAAVRPLAPIESALNAEERLLLQQASRAIDTSAEQHAAFEVFEEAAQVQIAAVGEDKYRDVAKQLKKAAEKIASSGLDARLDEEQKAQLAEVKKAAKLATKLAGLARKLNALLDDDIAIVAKDKERLQAHQKMVKDSAAAGIDAALLGRAQQKLTQIATYREADERVKQALKEQSMPKLVDDIDELEAVVVAASEAGLTELTMKSATMKLETVRKARDRRVALTQALDFDVKEIASLPGYIATLTKALQQAKQSKACHDFKAANSKLKTAQSLAREDITNTLQALLAQTRFKIDFDELSAAYDRARSVGLDDEVLGGMQVEKRLVAIKRMQRASAGLETALIDFAPATADIPTLVLALDEARSAEVNPALLDDADQKLGQAQRLHRAHQQLQALQSPALAKIDLKALDAAIQEATAARVADLEPHMLSEARAKWERADALQAAAGRLERIHRLAQEDPRAVNIPELHEAIAEAELRNVDSATVVRAKEELAAAKRRQLEESSTREAMEALRRAAGHPVSEIDVNELSRALSTAKANNVHELDSQLVDLATEKLTSAKDMRAALQEMQRASKCELPELAQDAALQNALAAAIAKSRELQVGESLVVACDDKLARARKLQDALQRLERAPRRVESQDWRRFIPLADELSTALELAEAAGASAKELGKPRANLVQMTRAHMDWARAWIKEQAAGSRKRAPVSEALVAEREEQLEVARGASLSKAELKDAVRILSDARKLVHAQERLKAAHAALLSPKPSEVTQGAQCDSSAGERSGPARVLIRVGTRDDLAGNGDDYLGDAVDDELPVNEDTSQVAELKDALEKGKAAGMKDNELKEARAAMQTYEKAQKELQATLLEGMKARRNRKPIRHLNARLMDDALDRAAQAGLSGQPLCRRVDALRRAVVDAQKAADDEQVRVRELVSALRQLKGDDPDASFDVLLELSQVLHSAKQAENWGDAMDIAEGLLRKKKKELSTHLQKELKPEPSGRSAAADLAKLVGLTKRVSPPARVLPASQSASATGTNPKG